MKEHFNHEKNQIKVTFEDGTTMAISPINEITRVYKTEQERFKLYKENESKFAR